MVSEAYVELWNIIGHSPLQILGNILLDVYISATARTMHKEHKEQDDNDDYDEEEEEVEEEPFLIQKLKRNLEPQHH